MPQKRPTRIQHKVANKQTNSGAIQTEQLPLVGGLSANFSRYRMSRGQRNKYPRPLISVF
jgi:hypothetical protein